MELYKKANLFLEAAKLLYQVYLYTVRHFRLLEALELYNKAMSSWRQPSSCTRYTYIQ